MRGLVLAGGLSSRMGTDKAALVVDGRTLLARSVELLQAVTTTVHVVVRPDQADDQLRRQFALLFDAGPAQGGPAAALVAAWLHDPAAAWLVLACDMPAVEPGTLAALVTSRDSSRGGTAWVVPGEDLPEPLCAIWEPATLARLAAAARQDSSGTVSPRAVLAAANPVLLRAGRPADLGSVNTPADLRRYRELRDAHES